MVSKADKIFRFDFIGVSQEAAACSYAVEVYDGL